MFSPYEVTEDGFESMMQINYLSHFLLTHLMLPKLKNAAVGGTANARIINVSSVAMLFGKIKEDPVCRLKKR